ncbi:hypothetical protein [Polaromonas aquatica]|uniref:hypothetical protein n=1 Tax=Polaromonas aquatica TaxID=332657 RepID=UPI003D65576A
MFKTILFGVLGVIVGAVFLRAQASGDSELRLVMANGKTAVVEPIKEYKSFSRSGQTIYTAELKFRTDTGQAMTIKRSFPEAVLKDFEAGRPVNIYYMPGNPSQVGFAQEAGGSSFLKWVGWFFVIASLGYTGLGLLASQKK